MATPASTRPYAECKYTSAGPTITLDADILPPAVTITLTSIRRAQDGTRHIVLHPDEPVIIGRSSRSEAKNLSSSTDNALFDCPVISRRHAAFELSLNSWDANDMHKIYITDTGSMHGTSVNKQKLQPHKRFQLRVGDVIRLGDSVNHGQSKHPLAEMRRVSSHADSIPDSYDGVMITLDCISVASQRQSTQAKSNQRGISCPSEIDSDSDDDSVEEVEAPSSAQTTPDQPSDKPTMKKLTGFGTSILTGIVLDDENEPESAAQAPRITSRSIVVPDTYDEDSYDAPDDAPEVERRLQFDDAVVNYSRHAAAGQQPMDGEDAVYGAQESELNFSDDAQSQVSNYDNTSDAASSHHSFSSEADSLSDLQDDDDEHGWAEQNDLYSIHDDQDEEEGPEVMSSKRTQSVEIGTLGDALDHEYEPSDEPPRVPAVPTRSHYDPVRGMFQVAAAPNFTDNARPARSYDSYPPPSHSGAFADVWNSSKWDVGPADLASNDIVPQSLVPHHWAHDAIEAWSGSYAHGEQYSPLPFVPRFSRYQPVHTDSGKDHGQDTPSVPTFCDVSRKRKASEISTSFEPTSTAPEFQPPSVEDPQPDFPQSVSPEQLHHEVESENTVVPAAIEEPLTAEPQPKKLKMNQPRTKKSMLRAAALEASKYTAGAIIGGIGLITILASPIGEALASC